MKHFCRLLCLMVLMIPLSIGAVDVIVPGSDNLDPELKQKKCEKDKTNECIDSLCRFVEQSDCHAKCREHAVAKCEPNTYDSGAEKKSVVYDKVLNAADNLNTCIEACRLSEDRNCSNKCKSDAKKAIAK